MRSEVAELLMKLEAAIRVDEGENGFPEFTVKASVADIVELVLAFHNQGFFEVEGEPATQKWLIEWAERAFGKPLKNWEQVANQIRNRKSSTTIFLDELKRSLNERFDRILHDKQYQRRLRNK